MMLQIQKKRRTLKTLLVDFICLFDPYRWEPVEEEFVPWYGRFVSKSRFCWRLSRFIWSKIEKPTQFPSDFVELDFEAACELYGENALQEWLSVGYIELIEDIRDIRTS